MKSFKTAVTGLIAAGILVTSVSATYSAGGGYTTGSNVNLRSGAGTDSSVIDTIDADEYLVVTGSSGNWYKVDYQGTTGYISSQYLSYSQIVDGDFGYAFINGNYVRMRSGPGTSYSVLGMYNYGTEMSVIGVSYDWYKVNYGGTVGYVRSDLMTFISASDSDSSSTDGVGTVTGSSVRMRSGPGVSYSILTVFDKGTAVTVNGQSGNWYKISYNGMDGYISATYLSVVNGGNSSDTTPSGLGTGTVTGSSVRMRTGPGTSYSIIDTLAKGTSITVISQSGSWYEISYGGYTGYMSGTYVSLNSDNSNNNSDSNLGTGIVTGSGVRLRTGPGTSYSIITNLNYGNTVTVTGTSGNWYSVDYNGTSGYMSMDYIRLSSDSDNGSTGSIGETIVSRAMSYLGVPYVYGGSSPSGFDCSGFVYYLYRANDIGIMVSRRASTQAREGIEVSKSELQPGDLVFFDNDGNPYGYVDADHVGIYIGNGQFIHASSGGSCVKINNLSDAYYEGTWFCARRVIGYV